MVGANVQSLNRKAETEASSSLRFLCRHSRTSSQQHESGGGQADSAVAGTDLSAFWVLGFGV